MARAREVIGEVGDYVPEDENDAPELGDLSILSEAEQDFTWQVYRIKSQDELSKNPRGKPRVWVTKLHGGVDLADFHARHGGGVYEFWGTRGGARGIQCKPIVELDGPPRPVLPEPIASPQPQSVTQPTTNGHSDAIVALLDRMDRRLAALERPSQAHSSIKDMVEALAGLDAMVARRSPPEPTTDTGIAKEMFTAMSEAMKTGLELGQAREPLPAGEGGTDWVKIFETAAPLANKVLDRMAAAQAMRRPAPPPTRHPGPPSGAEAVDPAEPARPVSGTVEPDISQVRMMALMDALARAINDQTDPSDFADTVSDMLTDAELSPFLINPPDAVIAEIAAVGVRYPVLATDQAKAYIGAVLAALRGDIGTASEADAE